jgi:hypothetical protein
LALKMQTILYQTLIERLLGLLGKVYSIKIIW